MAYKAIVDFKDLQTGHDYKSGDTYPYEGKADFDRIKQLITPTTQRGPLIEEVEEKTIKEVVEKKPKSSYKKKKEE